MHLSLYISLYIYIFIYIYDYYIQIPLYKPALPPLSAAPREAVWLLSVQDTFLSHTHFHVPVTHLLCAPPKTSALKPPLTRVVYFQINGFIVH